jgi:hypothetical protein
MTVINEKVKFLLALVADRGDTPQVRDAALNLLRLARIHQSYQTHRCNGPAEWILSFQTREAWIRAVDRGELKTESAIREICKDLGLSVTFGGDPRGFTVKLHFPKTRAYNSWGGVEEGYGVPTGSK